MNQENGALSHFLFLFIFKEKECLQKMLGQDPDDDDDNFVVNLN